MKKTITLFILLCILCVGQMWGETIPAGTIIYVDVTNFEGDKGDYNEDGKYYMSVTASVNVDKNVKYGNVTGANWDNGYDARKDTEWQELKLLSGNLYAGIVENESTVGSVSFWRKELSSSDHLWEVDACTPNMWDSSKRKFIISSDKTHHNDRHVYGFGSSTSSIYLYPVGSTLYLKVNSDWKSGNPRFAACFKGYADDSWVDAAQLGESDYYSITVPEGEWPYVIFCRMNAATTENNWNNKWDQTDNLYAETDKNLCTITGWSNSQTRGVYAPTALIVGAMNDWEVLRGIPLTNGSAKLSLNADAAYPFQIISGESWYGYGDTHHTLTFAGQTTSQALTAGKKDVLLLTASADEYTFTWNEGTKTVSVSHPTVTHPCSNYVYYKNTKGWTNVYAHIYGTKATVFPGPQLNSCSFGDVTYYYAALGNNANIEFNQGNSTGQDDLTNIASNKGKYYDPSTTSWKSFTTRITLDNESATSAGTEYVDADIFFTTLANITTPSKTGYEFGGYWTGKNGIGVLLIEDDGDWIASVSGYTDGDTKWIKESPTVTLYAKWTPKTTTITLHANGGSADGAVVATYDAALPSFDAITRSQHVLTGYWTSATGGTKVINADGSFAANSGTWNREDGEKLELYAQWWGLTTPTVTPTTTNWPGSNVNIALSATSTYLAEPIVVFYVSDGTNTYEVMGAPYGNDGENLGTIGAAGSNYSTVHKATFTAKAAGTYTVTAKLYEGKFIDNFEDTGSVYWSSLGYGACDRVTNVEREGSNGSNTVLKVTRNNAESATAWTTTTATSGTKTDWNYTYRYIHMRYYAPQAETPKVQYWDNGETYKNTTLSSVSAEKWHKLAFAVSGGEVDLIHPFITSADGNSIYIDDVVLSNEETMTAKVTTASAATTIYSLSSVTVDPTSSADYFDTPIDIALSATSTGLANSVVIFLVNDGTTTFEVVGTPSTPGGSPSYTTEHTATFTTSTPGDYTVTAKLYDAKLIDNFDGLSAYWKAMEDGTFDAAATNPAQQAVNGSSTVMQITRGNEEWKTVCTQQAADNDATTNWNLDYGYIYISMYSTTARTPKLKYSDDDSGYEVALDANSLSANTWQRKQFATTHDIDYILPFMPTEGTMYIDDIILSNESSMTAKATSLGDATAFRVNDNKYYFTGNNKSSTAWNTVANWNRGEVPSSTSEVFILAPVEIATGTTVHVDKVNIVTGGSITPPNGSSMTASGHLTIAPNAGLNVTGKIRKIADGAYPDTRIATTPADLILESSTAGNASLIFENDENQATVLMYSKASIPSEDVWNWQFIGIPFTTTNANPTYYNSYLYKWASNGSGWEEVANGAAMTPFTGYCITQDAASTYVMEGTLNPNNNVEINIPAAKEFVMANSWTGPIFVSGFTNTTLPLTDKTIYLYNTGYTPDPENPAEPGTEAGTYVAVPIHSAPYTGNDLIAPMQGFYVDNTSGSAATVTLKYDELVRPSIDRTIIAGPMHAPKRTQDEENRPTVLKLWANGAVYNDCAVVLEREDFSTGFDNGWDGKKLSFGEVGPSVYVINSLGTPEAVSAIPDLEGTLVGFRAGTNNTCTMSFEYNGEDTFYLNDLQAQQSTQIASENSYTFTCTAGDNEARFIISATPISKTPTDVEPLTAHPSPLTVTKVLLNNHIYIIRDGRMFSMDGTLVK